MLYIVSLLESQSKCEAIQWTNERKERRMSSLELPQFIILESVDKVPSVLIDLQEGSNSQFRFRALLVVLRTSQKS